MEECIVFICPHCFEPFVVHNTELNCRIIRHFVFRNFEQLDPHASKEECDRVVREQLGFGCALPVELIADMNGKWSACICDYI